VPGLEATLVACLERIFKTKCGASLIPHYMVCNMGVLLPFIIIIIN
jgi:hypothetical protein